MRNSGIGLLVLLAGLMAGCAPAPQPPGNPPALISTYVAAYNDRDIEAMAAMMHPEIQWISIDGAQTVVIADGKSDLVGQMSDYIASGAATQSTLGGAVVDGRFVAIQETANWQTSDGAQRTQSALAVYEIEDELVRRVWYYPATQ